MEHGIKFIDFEIVDQMVQVHGTSERLPLSTESLLIYVGRRLRRRRFKQPHHKLKSSRI